jgi:hypothetical protein
VTDTPNPPHDWRAEALGLAWMILNIDRNYQQAVQHLGGNSELLQSAVHQAASYVTGPLAVIAGFSTAAKETA